MRIKLLCLRNHAAIEGVGLLAHHRNHDGLLHAVRNHLTNHFLAPAGIGGLNLLCVCLGHYLLSVLLAASSRSRPMVFTRAISLRMPRIFFRLSVCPMLSWNFS